MTMKELSQITKIPYMTLSRWKKEGGYRRNLYSFLEATDKSVLEKYFGSQDDNFVNAHKQKQGKIMKNENPSEKEFKNLDEAFKWLESEPVLNAEEELIESLYDTSDILKTAKKQNKYPDQRAASRAVKDFAVFDALFKETHQNLKDKSKKIIPVINSQDIKAGDFFIIKGVMLYVQEVGEFFISENGYKNAHIKVIYENGCHTEELLFNSLAARLRSVESYQVV